MKVSELSAALLDYWVARAEGYVLRGRWWWRNGSEWCTAEHFAPSQGWTIGGPIIERERIGIEPWDDGRTGAAIWVATTFENRVTSPLWSRRSKSGATPLIAAMRCYVASKFGEEVPDEVPHG